VYEALMELGATVCTPASPRCGQCPIRRDCRAASLGVPERFPRPRRLRQSESMTWVALWLAREDGRILLRRVEGTGFLAGLWLPPFVDAGTTSPERAATGLALALGVRTTLYPSAQVRHSITHRKIRVLPFVGTAAQGRTGEQLPGLAWELPGQPSRPTSSLLGKLAGVCTAALAQRRPFRDPAH